MVAGTSNAASDYNTATTPPVIGSVSFAFVWAFVSVLLLLSMYTAYSSRASGKPCSLFLSPNALLACNVVVCLGIPSMHHVYGQCVVDNIGLTAMILVTTAGVWGGWVLEMIVEYDDPQERSNITSLWEVCVASGMIILADARYFPSSNSCSFLSLYCLDQIETKLYLFEQEAGYHLASDVHRTFLPRVPIRLTTPSSPAEYSNCKPSQRKSSNSDEWGGDREDKIVEG